MIPLSNELLITILILVVTFFFPLTVLSKRKINKGITIIISLCIALLSYRFLTYEQFRFIETVTGVGGTMVAIFIPFVIMFFFIYVSALHSFMRRVVWALYGAFAVALIANANIPYNDAVLFNTVTMLIILGLIMIDPWIKKQFNKRKALKGT